MTYGRGIDGIGHSLLRFGTLDIGIGGAIEDHIGTMRLHKVLHRLGIGQIDLAVAPNEVIQRSIMSHLERTP